jgi:tetratricopeptide (TPR) repeat protein
VHLQHALKYGAFREGWPKLRTPCSRHSQNFKKIQLEEKESIATVYHNLGYLYKTMGQYTKAEVYFQKGIRMHERVKGQDHEYAGMVKEPGLALHGHGPI